MRIIDESRAADYETLEATVHEESGLVGPPPALRAQSGTGRVAVMGNGHVTLPPGTSLVNGSAHRNGAAATNGHAPDLNGSSPADPAEQAVRFRTMGGFAVVVDGRDWPLDSIKPRARSLLRLLAIHAGSAVHREVIAAALWPEADAQTAARSLQVAVSAVRGLFVDALGPDGGRLVIREGDAYRLGVDPEAVDVRRFDRAVGEARLARARGADVGPPLATAMALYGGDLLPEEGPTEWIVEQREHYRSAAVDVAREAAEAALLGGDPRAAVESCRAGIGIDRYHDPLWRLLIEARQAAGDVSAANRDRKEYEAILSELGVPEAAFTSS
jgi:DNA-binding SARP family transcriptional activator